MEIRVHEARLPFPSDLSSKLLSVTLSIGKHTLSTSAGQVDFTDLSSLRLSFEQEFAFPVASKEDNVEFTLIDSEGGVHGKASLSLQTESREGLQVELQGIKGILLVDLIPQRQSISTAIGPLPIAKKTTTSTDSKSEKKGLQLELPKEKAASPTESLSPKSPSSASRAGSRLARSNPQSTSGGSLTPTGGATSSTSSARGARSPRTQGESSTTVAPQGEFQKRNIERRKPHALQRIPTTNPHQGILSPKSPKGGSSSPKRTEAPPEEKGSDEKGSDEKGSDEKGSGDA